MIIAPLWPQMTKTAASDTKAVRHSKMTADNGEVLKKTAN